MRSVASQQGVEIEHVIYDGGSSDETIEILKNFKSSIRWVSERDGGQTDAVNKGIKNSSGDIIGWLNSDDIYYPDAVIKVVDYFKLNPDIDVVYGKADHIDLNDVAFEEYPTEPWNYERLKETCFICQPALFMRRSIVEKNGLLDESLHYCMDYEYWLRLGGNGAKFAYIEEKLAGSRMYAENKTLGSRLKVHKEINDMFRKLMSVVPDKWIFNYAHAAVDQKINRPEHPALYIVLLISESIMASLRWNYRVSVNMLRVMWSWVPNFKIVLKSLS